MAIENNLSDGCVKYMTNAHKAEHKGKKPFHEMNPNEFIEVARGLHEEGHEHYIEDLTARVKGATEVIREYHKHHSRLEHELLADFDKIDLKQIKPIHDKVQQAYKRNEHKPLSQPKADEYLRNILDVILPEIGYGVKGNKEQMQNSFESYVSELLHNKATQEKASELKHRLDIALKNGEGILAAQMVLELMKMYKRVKYEGMFNSYLLNPSEPDFIDTYAEHIAGEVTSKTGIEVKKSLMARNFEEVFGRYIGENYLDIANTYKKEEKTKKKTVTDKEH